MFYLALFLVFFHVGVMSDDVADHTQSKSIVHIGAIFDENSPEGAIAKTCMSMAISDFYALHPHHWTRLVLHPTTANDLGSTAAAGNNFMSTPIYSLHLFMNIKFSSFICYSPCIPKLTLMILSS